MNIGSDRHELVTPYGEEPVYLITGEERRSELKALSREWHSWTLAERQICDLELLLNGGFSPLRGFMSRADYESVLSDMRLSDGMFWPLPIVLDVNEEMARELKEGHSLALRNPEGVMLAVMHVEDVWQPDKEAEVEAVFGNLGPGSAGARAFTKNVNDWYVYGRFEGIQLPVHYDFRKYRLTPREVRAEFTRMGWRKIISFQVRNVIHRTRYEFTLRAAKREGANLLIHPVADIRDPGNLNHYTRIKCYREVLRYYPQSTVRLALLPLAVRMAGKREAYLRSIIARNYGCTHLLVDDDLESVNQYTIGDPFIGPDLEDDFIEGLMEKTGIQIIPYQELAYVDDRDEYLASEEIPPGSRVLTITGRELSDRLADGRSVPEWFSFKEVIQQLRVAHPPRYNQGFTVFFTGLSGAGKSTIANALLIRFLQMGGRPVTLLDGDIVRRNLSSELGFSKEHRDINIRRIGFVASEITKNGGIAICAPIAPYNEVRHDVRKMIDPLGGFILVHVATPLEVCELRDRKGLYAKARAGLIKGFTGISDPYEVPDDPDLVIDTTSVSPYEAAQEIILYLEKKGYIGPKKE